MTGAHNPKERPDRRARGVDYLGLRSKTGSPNECCVRAELKAIGAFCIGTNQIDLATAIEMGIARLQRPVLRTRSVASELAIGEIIDL